MFGGGICSNSHLALSRRAPHLLIRVTVGRQQPGPGPLGLLWTLLRFLGPLGQACTVRTSQPLYVSQVLRPQAPGVHLSAGASV